MTSFDNFRIIINLIIYSLEEYVSWDPIPRLEITVAGKFRWKERFRNRSPRRHSFDEQKTATEILAGQP